MWKLLYSLQFIPTGLTINISIGSDNGLASDRWQVVMWTNGDLFVWHKYASWGLDGLSTLIPMKCARACISFGLFLFHRHYTMDTCILYVFFNDIEQHYMMGHVTDVILKWIYYMGWIGTKLQRNTINRIIPALKCGQQKLTGWKPPKMISI